LWDSHIAGSSILCFWRQPSFFLVFVNLFLFKLFRRSIFESCSWFFSFYPPGTFVLEVLSGTFLYFLSVYSTIFYWNLLILPSSISMELFIFFFCHIFFSLWLLVSRLIMLSFLRHALFLLGLCSLFLLKGFSLVYLFERWQHSNFSSTRTFFESILSSLLHICCSQIVEAMTDPILRATKGFSPWASGLLNLRTFGTSHLFYFFVFLSFSFSVSLTFFRLFLYLTASTRRMEHHGSLGIWVSSILW
jgi:hypothetical protein